MSIRVWHQSDHVSLKPHVCGVQRPKAGSHDCTTARFCIVRSLMRGGLRATAFLVLTLCVASTQAKGQSPDSAASPPQRPPTADSVIVIVTVSALYDDSRESLRQLRRLASAFPAEIDTITSSISFNQLILNRYNVSVGRVADSLNRRLPETFELLASDIASRNGLSRAGNMIPPGPIAVPAIPKGAAWQWSGANLKNYTAQELNARVVPILPGVAGTRRDVGDVVLQTDTTPTSGGDVPRSQIRSIRVAIPLSEAERGLEQYRSLMEKGEATIAHQPFTFSYELPVLDSAERIDGELTPSVMSALQSRLREPKRAHVPLVLLETAWPDPDEARISCERAFALLADVRRMWKLGEAGNTRCDPKRYRNSPNRHSAPVAKSIRPLRGLIADSIVNVMFVPMSRDQGADSLLHEFFRVAALQRSKEAVFRANLSTLTDSLKSACEFNLTSPTSVRRCAAEIPLSETQLASATKDAEEAMARLAPRMPVREGNEEFYGSSALVAAVFDVLNAYARGAESGAVLNTSWVVPALLGSGFRPISEDRSVILVAATGNKNGVSANSGNTPVEFASWSEVSPQVVAVINMDTRGAPKCKSSVVLDDELSLLRTNVVGFDGFVESNVCATSFAAPRVAWLLAASEAIRNHPFVARRWANCVSRQLAAQRRRDLVGLGTVLLDPIRLLDDALLLSPQAQC
jgi:hypothetical protein